MCIPHFIYISPTVFSKKVHKKCPKKGGLRLPLKGGGVGIIDNGWGQFISDKINKARELKQVPSDSKQDYLSNYLLFKSIHPFITFSSITTKNLKYASRDSLLVIGH